MIPLGNDQAPPITSSRNPRTVNPHYTPIRGWDRKLVGATLSDVETTSPLSRESLPSAQQRLEQAISLAVTEKGRKPLVIHPGVPCSGQTLRVPTQNRHTPLFSWYGIVPDVEPRHCAVVEAKKESAMNGNMWCLWMDRIMLPIAHPGSWHGILARREGCMRAQK